MKLFIQVENRNTINHPAFEENLIQAFGCVPDNWEPFERKLKPEIQTYQLFESEEPSYEKINGVWTDVWYIREMTEEEKTNKQNTVKSQWLESDLSKSFNSWVFDENTCSYIAPIPYPNDGKRYIWDEVDLQWQPISNE